MQAISHGDRQGVVIIGLIFCGLLLRPIQIRPFERFLHISGVPFPGWYEAEHVVPTWNYVAVHVTGTTQIVSDRDELWELVRSLTDHYESGMPNPWTLPESTAIDRMLDQIVGFRLQIERIEGKWKLNQNHSRERRLKVIARLREQGDANSLAMARLMEVSLEDSAD